MNGTIHSRLFSGIAGAALLMVGAANGMAATPAAPVLATVNAKVADAQVGTHGGQYSAVDGTTMYVAGSGKVFRSSDSGATWGGGHSFYRDPQTGVPISVGMTSIAVSGDAVYPTQRIIHVVFEADSSIYYTWADATNLDSWSTPLRLNGSMGALQDPNIVVSKTGKIHVMVENDSYQLFYLTAANHESGFFTEPVMVPVSSLPIAGDAEMYLDKTENLHLSYPYYNDAGLTGIKYTRLPAGSSTWTTPANVLAPTLETDSGHTALTAFDANNVYIESILNGNLTFFGTTNGGTSWTKKVIVAKSATLRSSSHLDIAVNASKAITAGAVFVTTDAAGNEISRDVKLYRSTDGGATWSAATTIAKGDHLVTNVYSTGKVGVVTRSFADGEAVAYISREK